MEMNAIPDGFKMTELGMLPEEWVVVRLEEISEVKGGKRLPKGHTFADHSTQYPYIRVIDFKNNSIDESNLKFLTPEDGELLKRYTISSKDVYISIAGTIGLSGFVPDYLDNANLTENAAKIIINDETQMNKYFLTYFLQCHKGQEQITIRTSKTSQPKLALIRIKQIPVPLPPLPEQRTIAKVLSTVQQAKKKTDTVISATKELKKSMMKHLFSYGPVPVKKFNELGELDELGVNELQNAQNSKNSINLKETEIGLVPEEWEVKPLIDIATLQRGKDLPKQKQIPGTFPIVGSSGILGYHNKPVCAGPGVVTGRSGSIGKLTFVEEDYWPHNTGLYVKDFHGNIPKFVYYLLHLFDFKKYATGVSVPTLNRNFVHSVLLPCPPEAIQRQIASILSIVDKKIGAEEAKKKSLDELFKSLLHNLMTGKVRVNHIEVML